MPVLHHLAFEGHTLPVLHRRDGILLFEGSPLARLLGYADVVGALHAHCHLEGFVFGNQPRPTIWIDIRNVHLLALHSESPVAERLMHWISHRLLPYFGDRRSQPRRRRVAVGERQLNVLNWQDECWLRLGDTLPLLDAADQALLKTLAELRSRCH